VIAGAATGCVGTELQYPGGGDASEQAPAGVTLNVTEFTFDGLGRPNLPGVTITFTSSISGDPPRAITVAAETGYVTTN
jgi:hypothetical protein